MKKLPDLSHRTGRFAVVLLALVLFVIRAVAADTNAPAGPPAPELEVADNFMLAIPKAGFGKEYLFTASVIPQQLAATSSGLEGKIVKFELYSDGVDMYESTRGLVVTEDLPARRLLASFPIVAQDARRVVIDFNKGMHRVFTQSWTEGGGLDMDARDRVLEVPDSRVFEVRAENGRLVVRQSVQVRDRESDANLESRLEVRYFLSPYRPGNAPGKEPSIADSRYTRFFETEGQIEPVTGRISERIARFDIRHPIVFYYSANTPADYVDAVKDGILYWNKAFGKEIVQAKKAPDGATAPDAQYNIIQWVPWDNAGFAYADVLMDPLSGESEHGQAYITSVFAFQSRAAVRALLRSMEEMAEAKKDTKKDPSSMRFGVPFLASAPSCQVDPREFAQAVAHGLQELLASDQLTDEAVLRASQDYVREVVSHEVGHVIGLRHNFAGSLATTLTEKELDDWFKAYLTGQPLDAYTNKISGNSVMEYNVMKSAMFIGWRMRMGFPALPQDHAAIAWGYFDSTEARDKKMLFATDEDVGRYEDVRRFDYGADPLIDSYNDIAETIDLLPNNIIETFISARAPRNPNDRIPLEQVNLRVGAYASRINGQFSEMLDWFKPNTRSVRVEEDFDFIGDLNRKERYQAHWRYLTNQVDELGGVDRAFFSFLPLDLKLDMKSEPTNLLVVQRISATNLTAKLEKLLNSTNYMTFVGLDEKKYSFTKDERDLILKRGRKFFEELEKEVVKQYCQTLTSGPRTLDVEANGAVSDDDVTAKLEQRIIDTAKLVIMAKDDGQRLDGKVDKGYAAVTPFKYDQETRIAAAKALADGPGAFKGWAEEAKSDLNTQLKNEVESALNISHFKDFKVALLSRPLHEWYQQQQDILQLLPSTK